MRHLTNAQEYEQELTRIFNRFNKHFWNNELPDVIITFVPTLKAHGHVTASPVWHSNGGDSKYELNISAYTIDRAPNEICATLLHEQCHLYNLIHNITDTSNMGRYHNKNFKNVAEDHGLVVNRIDSYGWSDTSLTDASRAYVKKLNIKTFTYSRARTSKGKNLKRFSCPQCGRPKVYAAKDQHVLCGYCHIPLVYMPTDKA